VGNRRRLHLQLRMRPPPPLTFTLHVAVIVVLVPPTLIRRHGRTTGAGSGSSGTKICNRVAACVMIPDGVVPHVVDRGGDTFDVSLSATVASPAWVTSLAETT
jgi:hypothetical protein